MRGSERIYMKRLLAILLILILVTAAFVACKKDDAEAGDTGTDSGSEPVSDSESVTVEYVSKNVTVTEAEETPVELPKVPILPSGELPAAE